MVRSVSRWNKLRHLWLLKDDGKTRRLANDCPHRPAFRFSARFGGPGWSSQLVQQFVDPAAHLLQGHATMFALPWAQLDLNEISGQKQLIMRNGHNQAPALKLLWGAQARLVPQQALFIEAIAMLLTKSQSIPQRNLRHVFLLIAQPDQPTDAWVTLAIAGMRPNHLNHGEREPAGILDMQIEPPRNFHRTTFAIFSAGVPIGSSIGCGVASLQEISIFARGPSLARWGRSRSIESAILIQSSQDAHIQVTALTPQPRCIVASVQHDNTSNWHLPSDLLDLCDGDLDCRRVRLHSLLIQNEGVAAWLLIQNHQGRKVPSVGDRFRAFGQIMNGEGGTVCGGSRKGTSNPTHIDPHPQTMPWQGTGCIPPEDFSQCVLVNTPIFQSLVDRRPLAFKPQRLGDFWQRGRLWFTHQCVYGIEQGIFRFWETAVNIVTKLSDCVNVHLSKFPLLISSQNFTRSGSPSQDGGPFVFVSLNVREGDTTEKNDQPLNWEFFLSKMFA